MYETLAPAEWAASQTQCGSNLGHKLFMSPKFNSTSRPALLASKPAFYSRQRRRLGAVEQNNKGSNIPPRVLIGEAFIELIAVRAKMT